MERAISFYRKIFGIELEMHVLERNKVVEQNAAIQEQTNKLTELNKLKDMIFSSKKE